MRLKTSFILFMFTLELIISILIFIDVKRIKDKTKEIEDNNYLVHEYILNKIGG